MSTNPDVSEEDRMQGTAFNGTSLEHDYPPQPAQRIPVVSCFQSTPAPVVLPVSFILENPLQRNQIEQWVAEPLPSSSESDAGERCFQTQRTSNLHSKTDELTFNRLQREHDVAYFTVKVIEPVHPSRRVWFTGFGAHKPKDGDDLGENVNERFEDTIKVLREHMCKPGEWDSVEEANARFTSFLGVEPKLKDGFCRPEGQEIEIRYVSSAADEPFMKSNVLINMQQRSGEDFKSLSAASQVGIETTSLRHTVSSQTNAVASTINTAAFDSMLPKGYDRRQENQLDEVQKWLKTTENAFNIVLDPELCIFVYNPLKATPHSDLRCNIAEDSSNGHDSETNPHQHLESIESIQTEARGSSSSAQGHFLEAEIKENEFVCLFDNLLNVEFKHDGEPSNSETKALELPSSEPDSAIITHATVEPACFPCEEQYLNAVDEKTQVPNVPMSLTNEKKKETKKDHTPIKSKVKVQKTKCFPKRKPKSTLPIVQAPVEIPCLYSRKSLRTSNRGKRSSASGLPKKEPQNDQNPTIQQPECSSQPKAALPFVTTLRAVPSKLATSLPLASTSCKQEAAKSSPCGNKKPMKSAKKWYPSKEEQVELYKNHSFVIESEHYNKVPVDAIIWRILDRNMLALQKYIPINLNGRVIHKATGSFRTPEAKNEEFYQKYHPIFTVKHIDTENFQIFQYFNIDRILPQLLRMKETKELYHDFKVFIQAIAFEVCIWPAGYIKARVSADSDQCDEYYKTSWDVMEATINDRAKSIAADSWSTSGLISPFYTYPIIEWSNNKESDRSCMACSTGVRKATYKTEFIGKPYDQFSFEDLPGEFPPQENLYFCGTCVGYFKTIDNLVNHKWAMYRALRVRIEKSYCELEEDEHLDVDNLVESILNDHEWCIKCFLDFQVVLAEADVDIERLEKEGKQ